ncbi:MAG: hydrolase [Acidobacteria bacterium]|nr:hydrolase [Acidobacteriota bacterium]
MPHANILDPDKSALIVVDIQEAFRSAVPHFERIAHRAAVAVQGFRLLDVPVIVTEQYPKGLGATATEISEVCDASCRVFEKTVFSSCGADGFVEALSGYGVKQAVLCGVETHVCVEQTAHDLLDRGIQVHLLLDAVGSRSKQNRKAGIAKMQASGVIASSVEMALFELMRDAKHDKFKQIQALIK